MSLCQRLTHTFNSYYQYYWLAIDQAKIEEVNALALETQKEKAPNPKDFLKQWIEDIYCTSGINITLECVTLQDSDALDQADRNLDPIIQKYLQEGLFNEFPQVQKEVTTILENTN